MAATRKHLLESDELQQLPELEDLQVRVVGEVGVVGVVEVLELRVRVKVRVVKLDGGQAFRVFVEYRRGRSFL